MKAKGVLCDVCDKFVPSEEPPEDWILVVRVGQEWDEACEVCSIACLAKLAIQLRNASKDGKNVCPDCAKELPTKQGLSSHRTKLHGQKARKR